MIHIDVFYFSLSLEHVLFKKNKGDFVVSFFYLYSNIYNETLDFFSSFLLCEINI